MIIATTTPVSEILKAMRIPPIVILSSFFLLIVSNAYPQKDKSLQNVFIPEGYALDRNQVQYNQPKDFISYIDSLGKNKVKLLFLMMIFLKMKKISHQHILKK